MNYAIIVGRSLVFMLLLLATSAAMAGDPMKGRVLYQKACAGCHGENGLPQVVGVPNFKMGEGLMKSIVQFNELAGAGSFSIGKSAGGQASTSPKSSALPISITSSLKRTKPFKC